mmetsp:Transcript_10512/g.35147  ORF Transcript_10512/g.35147 Transcript_10512/m.35147 type:complete len:765 (-) Transcript_10512:290-2584(-)
MRLLDALPPLLRYDVDEFLFSKPGHMRAFLKDMHPVRDLKHVIIDEQGFLIVTENGFEERSEVLFIEDISYVTSPFLPWSLRRSEAQMRDNSTRAWESGNGKSQVQGDLHESLILSQVHAILMEWVPMSANEFEVFLEKFDVRQGNHKRRVTNMFQQVGSGILSKTGKDVPLINILEYKENDCLNFEAEIGFKNDEGICQVEEVAAHINANGIVAFGARVEAIQNRLADDISMDLLSRLLTDLQVDVSEMMENLLTTAQNHMLKSAFWGNSSSRSRFVLLFTSKIDPLLKADGYLDHGEYENEMSQVIGQLVRARDFGNKNNFIVVAQRGMLVVGDRLRRYDRLIFMLCELIAMNQFAVVLYKWTSNIQSDLQRLRMLTNVRDPNPNHFDEARQLRNETSEDIACLEEIMINLSGNLKKVHVPPSPFEDFGQKLYDFLELKKTHDNLTRQIEDLTSFVCCYKAEVRSISVNLRTAQNKRERGTVLKLEQETGRMIQYSISEREQTSVFEIMLGIIAFKFLLVFLDSFITARSRYFGIAALIDSSSNSSTGSPTIAGFSVVSTSSIGSPLSSNSYFPLQWAIQLDKIPFFTIVLHLVFCALFLVLLARAYRHRRHDPVRDVKIQTDLHVNLENLDAFVLRHKKKRIEVENDFNRHFKKYQFVPTARVWGPSKPKIIVMVDTSTTRLIWASITRNEKLSLWRWLLQFVIYRKFSGLSMNGLEEDTLNDILLDEFSKVESLADKSVVWFCSLKLVAGRHTGRPGRSC